MPAAWAALGFQTWLQQPSAGHSSSPHPTKPPSSFLAEPPVHCGEPHSRHTLHAPKTLPMALTSSAERGLLSAAPLSLLEVPLLLSVSVSSSPHVYWDLYWLFIN